MSGGELDRQQIRRAIRQMGNEYVYYLLDDAISLLSQAQLRQLIAPYANPDQFIEHEAPQKDLLAEVLAFQKTSLAGEYYEETPIAARNCEENSRGTLCWIADFRRLLGRCAAESSSASAANVCRTFEILFRLLDSLYDGTGEGIFFAEERGSWMVGVDWKRVLPAWFRVLAATVAPAEYSRRVEAIIRRHCSSEQAEMLVLARSVEMSVQQRPAREG
ncbi:MAG: hypothetical protein RB191_17470 [Terriglobia bacterium]|nr:hypothetical protein [Terriglobia bacterium]